MTAFTPTDTGTWPMTLTLDQVAAIYQRTPLAVQHALKPSSRTVFTPRPFQKHPYRWRRVDVLRHVEGARGLQRSA